MLKKNFSTNGGVGMAGTDLGYYNMATFLRYTTILEFYSYFNMPFLPSEPEGNLWLEHGCLKDSSKACTKNDEYKKWEMTGKSYANFVLNINTEGSQDVLVVVDSFKNRKTYFGEQKIEFRNVKLPLQIYWATDESAHSKGFYIDDFYSFD